MLKTLIEKLLNNVELREIVYKANSNLILRLLGSALAYVLVFSVVRMFGPQLYGQYSHSMTIFLVFRLLSNFGIKPATVRIFAELNREGNAINFYKKAIYILILTGLIGSVGVYLFAEEISILYGKQYLAPLLKILAFALLPYNLIDLNSAVFKGLRKIKSHTFLENIGNPLFSLSFISISYLIFGDFEFVFYSVVIALNVLALISFVMIYREFKLRDFSRTSEVKYREILSVSMPMFLTGSMDLIGRWADILVLGFFCSDFQIGAYHLVSRLATAISIPLQALNSIITPKFRQLYKSHNYIGLKMIARSTAFGTFSLALFSGVLLIVFGPLLIDFFEPEYVFAYHCLIVLVIGMMANSFFGSVLHLLNMTEGHKLLMYLSIITTATNIFLNILLIPKYNILGAAFSTSISMFLFYFLSAIIVKRRLSFFPYSFSPLLMIRTLKKN